MCASSNISNGQKDTDGENYKFFVSNPLHFREDAGISVTQSHRGHCPDNAIWSLVMF